MRALEKDRTRRYGAASDLAADIRRHLSSQPVSPDLPMRFIARGNLSGDIVLVLPLRP